jgi:16S rRNA (guanine1207-N2)-methyltransferase
MVANRQLPYEVTLKGLFKSVTTLEEADGFKIFDAKK